jgi:alcohol dehydrogenase
MKSFQFNTTRSIINEPGAIKRLGEICASHNISRPLIVTDQGIVAIGLLERLQSRLTTAGIPYACYCGVVADPPERVVLEALAQAKAEAVDGVIGFGGGSSMDTAKLVALMSRSGECLESIYGVDKAKGERLPLIQIPTTAGTGSEVTGVAIVTTGETTKAGVLAAQLLPDVAILDAELTLGLPADITAATGIDAMVHAIEAFTSVHKKNAYSDMLAREALHNLSANITIASHHGNNIEARQAMLYGACLAGQAFANAPVAAVHALAYPLGGFYHIPHGLSNSLVLPYVLRFNAQAAGQYYQDIARYILPVEDQNIRADNAADKLANYFLALASDLGLPTRLRDAEVKESSLPVLAEAAMLQQRLLINNPREVSLQDALEIYQQAY